MPTINSMPKTIEGLKKIFFKRLKKEFEEMYDRKPTNEELEGAWEVFISHSFYF